jgi:hypothetical protein
MFNLIYINNFKKQKKLKQAEGRGEINEIPNRKAEKSTKPKLVLEKVNKIDEILARGIKRKGDSTY